MMFDLTMANFSRNIQAKFVSVNKTGNSRMT